MAERYGGQFSPNNSRAGAPPRAHPYQGKVPTRLGLRVNALFALPFLFAISAFFSSPFGMALNLAGFGTMMLSAWLTREGLRAEAAYDQRELARRPAIPRKIFGSAAMAIGLGLAVLARGNMIEAVIVGAVAGIAHFLAFGPDPLRDKGMEGDAFQSERVAKAVDAAELELTAMSRALAPLKDRELETQLANFQTVARDMFRSVESDPRDLTAARKYLGVYLSGAREATEKYAAYYTRTGESQARADYIALIDDLSNNFAQKTETLLRNDRSQLDIEMEVLRERLAREPHLSPSRTLE